MDAVHDLLVRYLTDDAFRMAFDGDPAKSLAEYDLTDDERSALSTRDERVLALIGQAASPGSAGAQAPADPGAQAPESQRPPADAPPARTLELAPIAVWLSVLPHATTSEDRTHVQWQVSLHSEMPAQDEIARQSGVVFRVDLEPCAMHYQGQERVVFRSAIGANSTSAAHPPAPPAWAHDWTSPAAQAALERVRKAAPAERFDAVLELAQALEFAS